MQKKSDIKESKHESKKWVTIVDLIKVTDRTGEKRVNVTVEEGHMPADIYMASQMSKAK